MTLRNRLLLSSGALLTVALVGLLPVLLDDAGRDALRQPDLCGCEFVVLDALRQFVGVQLERDGDVGE